MMKALRDNTKVIIWFLAIAFVGTIIFAWGMDITGRRGSGGGSAPLGVVGTVNGRDIKLRNFGYAADRWIENARTQDPDKEFTDSDYRQARRETWESFIQELLQAEQIEKKKIKLTNQELIDFIRRYPPQQVYQVEEFQTEGNFDYNKYQQAMGDPRFEQLWIQIEALMRPQLINFKLQEYIGSMQRVSYDEVKSEYLRKNERIKVRYGLASLKDFDITTIDIDSQDVKDYYQANLEKYRRNELAYYTTIELSKTASQFDYDRALEETNEIKRELDAGGVFDTIASVRTMDPSGKSRGGDLGWFGQGQMVAEFDSAAFAMKVGEISPPIKTRFGYHLIYKKDERTKAGKKEVNAAHILIKPQISQETLDKLQRDAETFVQQAPASDDIKQLAENLGLSLGGQRKVERDGVIIGIGKNETVSEWLFTAADGSYSEVFDISGKYIILRKDKVTLAGITPLKEVYSIIERDLKREKQKEFSWATAEKIYGHITEGMALDEACSGENIKVKESAFFARNGRLPGMGQDPNFIGTAFTLSEGNKYSKPVMTQAGAAVLEFKEKLPATLDGFEAQRDTLRIQKLQTLRAAYWDNWFNGIIRKADIKDYRREVFGDNL